VTRPTPLIGGVLVALTLLVSGCAVRPEPSATRLDGIALPPESVPAEARPEEQGPTSSVFFIRDEGLVAVERTTEPTLAAALRGLLRGPRETEAQAGVGGAIPAGTTLRSASLVDGTATIDLSPDLAGVVGPEQVLAVAQLVYTATSVPGSQRVVLAIDGQPIDATRGDGSLATGPVDRSDYPGLLGG
jgi:hypothetical protein